MGLEDFDRKLGEKLNKIPNLTKLIAGFFTLCSIGFAIYNPYRLQADQIEKQNKEHLTACISSIEPYGSKFDSIMVNMVFSNQSEKNCYISDIQMAPNSSQWKFSAIDGETNKKLETLKLPGKDDLHKKYLFDLKPIINQNMLYNNNEYSMPDTYCVGIWANYPGEKSTSALIKNFLIYTQNGKVTGSNLSDTKQPVTIIDK